MTGFESADDGLRIGDAERNHAADLLGEHFRAGRLTVAEYDERITAAYAARTDADLRPLFADLPKPVSDTRPHTRQSAEWRRTPWPVLAMRGVGLAILGVVAIALILGATPFILIGLLVWAKFTGRLCGGHRHHHHRQARRSYRSRSWA